MPFILPLEIVLKDFFGFCFISIVRNIFGYTLKSFVPGKIYKIHQIFEWWQSPAGSCSFFIWQKWQQNIHLSDHFNCIYNIKQILPIMFFHPPMLSPTFTATCKNFELDIKYQARFQETWPQIVARKLP